MNTTPERPKRSCGSCTMCCKTMGVSDLKPEPKPVHVWCRHCEIGRGCSIYESRPTTCREFECIWLQDTRGLFGDEDRPDRLGVVFTTSDDGHGLVAQCDPKRPTAWRDPRAFKRLIACAMAGYAATARAGARYWVIGPKGEWEVPPSFLLRNERGEITSVVVPGEKKFELGLRSRDESVWARP